MTPKVCIVDTNVVVSGLLGADSNNPPARILDAMLDGTLLYLMSGDLLDGYSSVLRRPGLVRLQGRRMTKSIGCLPVWSPMRCGASPPSRATLPTLRTPTCGRRSRAIRRDNWSRVTDFFWKTLLAALPSRPLATSSLRSLRGERSGPTPFPGHTAAASTNHSDIPLLAVTWTCVGSGREAEIVASIGGILRWLDSVRRSSSGAGHCDCGEMTDGEDSRLAGSGRRVRWNPDCGIIQ